MLAYLFVDDLVESDLTFSALTLNKPTLVGRHKGHPACKKTE